MTLLEQLEITVTEIDSVFQAHLMREDIERIRKLTSLAENAESIAEFEKAGFFLNWTQNDLRTVELTDSLNPFLRAFYAAAQETDNDHLQAEVRKTWGYFNKERMRKLVGCL